jgi:hypothetical protein
MSRQTLQVEIRDRQVNAATAELHIIGRTATRDPSQQLRGRLTGPRCQFATTVEIAYPLRSLPSAEPVELAARVIIPEPSLWDPQSPFLYAGRVELWQGDCLRAGQTVRHGLRNMRVGPRGISINGKALAIRGKRVTTTLSDDEALCLRRDGYNLLVAPLTEATAPLWDMGDRFGLLVIGSVNAADENTRERMAALAAHPASAGWVTEGQDLPGVTTLSPETLESFGQID